MLVFQFDQIVRRLCQSSLCALPVSVWANMERSVLILSALLEQSSLETLFGCVFTADSTDFLSLGFVVWFIFFQTPRAAVTPRKTKSAGHLNGEKNPGRFLAPAGQAAARAPFDHAPLAVGHARQLQGGEG